MGKVIDLTEEQSYMRSAKFTGGLTHFQTQATISHKKVLCRPYKAKFTEILQAMMDLDKTSDNVRKCLRTSEILKPYKIVRSIIGFMETQFIGLSDGVFDKKKLYNLI